MFVTALASALSESVCFTCVSRQWLKSEDIQRISLFFHNKALEKEVGERIQNTRQHVHRGTNQSSCVGIREREVIKGLSNLQCTGNSCPLHILCTTQPQTFLFFMHHTLYNLHRSIFTPCGFTFTVGFGLFCNFIMLFPIVLPSFLSTVQIHNITSLQVLCHLRLPHILLYIHRAGPRLAQVSLCPPRRLYKARSPGASANSHLWQRVDVKKPFDASCLINKTTLK